MRLGRTSDAEVLFRIHTGSQKEVTKYTFASIQIQIKFMK